MPSVFCSPSVPDYVQLECGTELGGIVAFALFSKDLAPTLTDLQTPSYWSQRITASPQTIWVVKDTRGSYAGGTPVEEEGYGKVPTLRTGADHEANLEVRGVLNNRNFWAAINQTDKWNAALITNGEVGHYIEDVSVYAKQIIDQNIKSSSRNGVNLKWSDDLSNPVVFDVSAAAFDAIFNN
jgi:hypothetical protein